MSCRNTGLALYLLETIGVILRPMIFFVFSCVFLSSDYIFPSGFPFSNKHTCLLILSGLYQELGERGNEMENSEYQTKRTEELQKRLADAHASIHHIEIVMKTS